MDLWLWSMSVLASSGLALGQGRPEHHGGKAVRPQSLRVEQSVRDGLGRQFGRNSKSNYHCFERRASYFYVRVNSPLPLNAFVDCDLLSLICILVLQ